MVMEMAAMNIIPIRNSHQWLRNTFYTIGGLHERRMRDEGWNAHVQMLVLDFDDLLLSWLDCNNRSCFKYCGGTHLHTAIP